MLNNKVVSIEWYKIKTNHLSVIAEISMARKNRANPTATTERKVGSANNLLPFNRLDAKGC
ncbi:hypothetical protein GCM10007878_24930 [Marinospirillum insulare]|uniref:Uncharacterized protein n=1 Tax=Marinospirillum insulare TaxID=217169 RepID=A0ABQ6A4L5_9GAMM|nr:hypothetical protein GCM10007878_24930 [Marinospirillum insulare]